MEEFAKNIGELAKVPSKAAVHISGSSIRLESFGKSDYYRLLGIAVYGICFAN